MTRFRVLQTSFADPASIDDCTEAVGDWPEVEELCDKSPVGQCQYSSADGFRVCVHCGKGDGV